MKIGLFANRLLIAIAVMVAASGILFHVLESRDMPKNKRANDSQQVIDKVSMLYLLPTNETPTVARIQDAAKLMQDQSFYDIAENNDYVLIYSKSKLALLYREPIHKIVRVSTILIGEPVQE